MSDFLSARRQFAIEVVQRLRDGGFESLWAGGCVRDLLLERQPHDYDVATSAHPDEVRRLFGHKRTLAVGAAFGVIIVLGKDADAGQVEVATFRNDAQYSDGRRPDSVTFSTAREDAARRDFTINGMFYDPLKGEVIDYVGGQADLERSLIRAIGDADARIGEDKLRMLRAIRFAARFNFAIEAATESAIARHAGDLRVVSGERMTAEMHKTLETPGREMAVRTWAETGLMHVLLPDLAQRWDVDCERVCALLRAVEPAPWTNALAVCFLPLYQSQGAKAFDAVLLDLKNRLKFSNEDLEQLKVALRMQEPLAGCQQLAWSKLQPLLIDSNIDCAVQVLRARVVCGEVEPAALKCVCDKLQLPLEQLNPPPLIDGQVLRELGLEPGPRFKELLSHVRDAQLNGEMQDRAAAIAWVRKFLFNPKP